jgi:hypothetical protein
MSCLASVALPDENPRPPPSPPHRSPPTALSLLERFASLQPGDVVAQNGATSAVGQVGGPPARAAGVAGPALVAAVAHNWDGGSPCGVTEDASSRTN